MDSITFPAPLGNNRKDRAQRPYLFSWRGLWKSDRIFILFVKIWLPILLYVLLFYKGTQRSYVFKFHNGMVGQNVRYQ